jgi:hypothetical protein
MSDVFPRCLLRAEPFGKTGLIIHTQQEPPALDLDSAPKTGALTTGANNPRVDLCQYLRGLAALLRLAQEQLVQVGAMVDWQYGDTPPGHPADRDRQPGPAPGRLDVYAPPPTNFQEEDPSTRIGDPY